MRPLHHLHKLLGFACLYMAVAGTCSCKKFLDQQASKKITTPSTLSDLNLLLNDYYTLNSNYPTDGDASADDYYFTDAEWASQSAPETRDNYIWAAQGLHDVTATWQNPYKVVFYANQILEVLKDIDPGSGDSYNNIKGSAFFFRAFALYHIAQLFTPPYNAATAATDAGIPVRLSPDVNISYPRASVQQSYNQMVEDLQQAAALLPVNATVKAARPNKAAAFAMLARVYQTMENYTQAGIYADSCLKRYNTLLNYSTLNASADPVFTRFNAEVLFSALGSAFSPGALDLLTAKIDTALYNSYASGDLRKTLFYSSSSGDVMYRGGYDGSSQYAIFMGLATDEVYLIRAECYARADNAGAAMADLNTLLSNRWNSSFVPRTAANAGEALAIILTERRKELPFRGTRWTDLRRLNKESRFAKTLIRPMNTIPYTPLAPGDVRYTLLIPQAAIDLGGITQNIR